eukprot:m.161027 g.161027  ORF g.161027 m.161027 type:complete len:451 (-) comp12020_c0_seq1:147-1499(-)
MARVLAVLATVVGVACAQTSLIWNGPDNSFATSQNWAGANPGTPNAVNGVIMGSSQYMATATAPNGDFYVGGSISFSGDTVINFDTSGGTVNINFDSSSTGTQATFLPGSANPGSSYDYNCVLNWNQINNQQSSTLPCGDSIVTFNSQASSYWFYASGQAYAASIGGSTACVNNAINGSNFRLEATCSSLNLGQGSSTSCTAASCTTTPGPTPQLSLAPTATQPTTRAPTSHAPVTIAPTSHAPVTSPPISFAPVTTAPTASSAPTPQGAAPVTRAPTTVAPTTHQPTTQQPTTLAPTTVAPTTLNPTTHAPITFAPTTLQPTSAAASSSSSGGVSSTILIVIIIIVLAVIIVAAIIYRGRQQNETAQAAAGGTGATAFENPLYDEGQAEASGAADDITTDASGGYMDVPAVGETDDAEAGYMDVPAGGDEGETGYMDTTPNDDFDDDDV